MKAVPRGSTAILVVGLLAAAVVAIALMSSSTPPPSSFRTYAPEPVQVDARELYEAYDENEIAAAARYRGPLLVSGIAKDIGVTNQQVPYVVLGSNLENPFGVQAIFKTDTGLDVLKPGDPIRVRCGQSAGRLTVNVVLRGCELQ